MAEKAGETTHRRQVAEKDPQTNTGQTSEPDKVSKDTPDAVRGLGSVKDALISGVLFVLAAAILSQIVIVSLKIMRII